MLMTAARFPPMGLSLLASAACLRMGSKVWKKYVIDIPYHVGKIRGVCVILDYN